MLKLIRDPVLRINKKKNLPHHRVLLQVEKSATIRIPRLLISMTPPISKLHTSLQCNNNHLKNNQQQKLIASETINCRVSSNAFCDDPKKLP